MAGKIRLCHVLEATTGGTRRHILDLCLNLPRDRFEQHLVCADRGHPAFQDDLRKLGEAGVRVTVLDLQREMHPLVDWRCLRQLVALLRGDRPRIVHGHSAKGGFLARAAARRLPGTKTVYNPHGFPFQMRIGPLRRVLYLALERYAGHLTDRLVAVCRSQQELALSHRLVPAERAVLIRNGIRAEEFRVEVDREAYREALGLPRQAVTVGCVAALVPQKGVEYLVRAMATIRREREDVHLLLVGDGPLRRDLRRLAGDLGCAEAVHFLGARDDVPQLLACLDLFVLPSLWEGCPYALLEAGAAGVPVVSTRIPGITDVVTHLETGRLANPADSVDLAVQALGALADPQAATMAEALRRVVLADYTLQGMVEGHVRLYEELAQSP